MSARTGAQILVDQLLIQGADAGFCVPGESYLAVLDALADVQDRFRLVVCRHEAGAANMAEAAGKLTGRPGICFVTRGPGACHAAIGLHTAFQDSTPMILFIGQIARGDQEREAFQEIDYRRMFGPVAKWVAQIDEAARIPEFIGRAFHTAMAGRPGPVVLALPEDMLSEAADVADGRAIRVPQLHPDPADMDRLGELLGRARRPIAVLGGPGWTQAATHEIGETLARWDLPAVTSFRAKDRLDNRHACYVGDLGIGADPNLVRRVAEADLILAIGPRLGDMTTDGYTRIRPPVPAQTLVHVHAGAEELNRVYQPDLAICAGVPAFIGAFARLGPPANRPWAEDRAALRAAYDRFVQPVSPPGAVNPSAIFAFLDAHLPEDAILTNGAGNYAGWAHRFFRHKRLGSQLGPTSGAMGYGLPAAVAAKALNPARSVVALAGDGCFLMAASELATAAQYALGIIVLVFDNGMYGTIRMHQEKHYPGRVYATGLANPDFAALARAHGAFAATVRTTGDFEPAFREAEAHGGLALLHILTDPDAITPSTTLRAIRDAATR